MDAPSDTGRHIADYNLECPLRVLPAVRCPFRPFGRPARDPTHSAMASMDSTFHRVFANRSGSLVQNNAGG